MKRKLLIGLLIFISVIVAFSVSDELNPSDLMSLNAQKIQKNDSRFFFQYLPMKDTIFVLGNTFIEISLKRQTATLFTRHDSSMTFKISTGTSRINLGFDTPPGLFTVQNKSPVAISKQFENAEMFNWIGFRGNIGFHALKGSKYYWSLGIRPSSHGCVRISREDGDKLYKKVRTGTPVLVFNEEPAIILKFSDFKGYNSEFDELINRNDKYFIRLMSFRQKNLYEGMALRKNNGRIFMDGKAILRLGGLPIGSKSDISSYQKPPIIFQNYLTEKDNLYKYTLYKYDSLMISINSPQKGKKK
jgi:hypothetical protein